MKKLLIILLLITSFGVAKTNPARWVHDKLGFDGMTAEHYAGGQIYPWGIRTSFSLVNKYVYPVKIPSDATIWLSGATFMVIWEVNQYVSYDSYDDWCSAYGGEDEAWRNALVDIGVAVFSMTLQLSGKWKPDFKLRRVRENGFILNLQIRI